MEDFQQQVLDEIKKTDEYIERLEAKAEEQAKLSGEVHTELKDELKNWADTYKGLKERQDELEKQSKRLSQGEQERKGFKHHLADAIKENHDRIKNAKSTGRVQIELKDAITMTQGDSLTGEVIAPTRIPGIIHDPDRQVHVRQFLQTATTDSNAIRYVVEDGYEDGTAVTEIGRAHV